MLDFLVSLACLNWSLFPFRLPHRPDATYLLGAEAELWHGTADTYRHSDHKVRESTLQIRIHQERMKQLPGINHNPVDCEKLRGNSFV